MVGVAITEHGVTFDALAQVVVHPAAEIFPLLSGPEFNELVADIKRHGLREPVTFTPDGQLLDGRNRYRACRTLGFEPSRRTEESEPWAYVVSVNLHRRHLNPSQQAMIAAKIATRHPGEYQRANLPKGAIGAIAEVGAPDEPAGDLAPTRRQAMELLNVSQGSLTRAKRVLEQGTKALQQAVESGHVRVTMAEEVARTMTPAQQDEWAAKVNSGINPKSISPRKEKLLTRPHTRPQGATPDPMRSPSRHRYVLASAAQHLAGAFNAVGTVLESAPDGLDPSISSPEAQQLVDDLTQSSNAYRQLLGLLKRRIKENKS